MISTIRRQIIEWVARMDSVLNTFKRDDFDGMHGDDGFNYMVHNVELFMHASGLGVSEENLDCGEPFGGFERFIGKDVGASGSRTTKIGLFPWKSDLFDALPRILRR